MTTTTLLNLRRARIVETTAMGETWWNVVTEDAPEDPDERYVLGSFSKSRAYAQLFCDAINGTKTCAEKTDEQAFLDYHHKSKILPEGWTPRDTMLEYFNAGVRHGRGK